MAKESMRVCEACNRRTPIQRSIHVDDHKEKKPPAEGGWREVIFHEQDDAASLDFCTDTCEQFHRFGIGSGPRP